MEKTKAWSKKVVLGLLAAVLACTLGVTLVGCGASDEDKIKDAISAELDLIKNHDEATIEELEGSYASQFDQLGIDSGEFINSWLDGFNYTVDSVTVDGDSATANVTVTVKQLVPVLNEWQPEYEAYVAENALTLDYSTAMEQAGTSFMEKLNAAETTTATVALPLQKDSDGNWTLTSSASTEFANALLGDTSSL